MPSSKTLKPRSSTGNLSDSDSAEDVPMPYFPAASRTSDASAKAGSSAPNITQAATQFARRTPSSKESTKTPTTVARLTSETATPALSGATTTRSASRSRDPTPPKAPLSVTTKGPFSRPSPETIPATQATPAAKTVARQSLLAPFSRSPIDLTDSPANADLLQQPQPQKAAPTLPFSFTMPALQSEQRQAGPPPQTAVASASATTVSNPPAGKKPTNSAAAKRALNVPVALVSQKTKSSDSSSTDTSLRQTTADLQLETDQAPKRRAQTNRSTRFSDAHDTDTDASVQGPPSDWYYGREYVSQGLFNRYCRFHRSQPMYPPLSWSQMHQFAFTIFNNGKQIRRVDGDKYCGFAYLYEASNIALPNSAKRRLPMLKALRSALLPYAQALSPSRDLSRDEYATTEFLCAFSRLTDSILLIGQDTDPEPHEFLLNPPSAQSDEPRYSTSCGTQLILPTLDTQFFDQMDKHTSEYQMSRLLRGVQDFGRRQLPLISAYLYIGTKSSDEALYWPVVNSH